MRVLRSALVMLLPMALSAQDTTATKAALLAADRAAAAGASVLADLLADDATVLVDGQNVLRGRTAWSPRLAAFFIADGGPAWVPIHAVASRDGSFGCTTGVLRYSPMSATAPQTGRYAACWRRDANAWRMVALSRADAPAQVRALPDSIPGAPASAHVAAPAGTDARDAARAMADADRAFARFSADSGGPSGAFARWIAADGMMLGARAVPVRGSDQARAAFANFPATGSFTWGPIEALAMASRDGSLGFTVGEARIAATPSSVSYSKYLTVWRREPNGTYRFVFDIGSDRPAP